MARFLDRTVDVRLGREVDERVAAFERAANRDRVADVALHELHPLVGHHVPKGFEPTGIGQLVEHDRLVFGVLGEQVTHEVRADEPGSARYQDLHACASVLSARKAASPSCQSGRWIVASRSVASTENEGRGAGRPSMSVVVESTRHSIRACLKISIANSYH